MYENCKNVLQHSLARRNKFLPIHVSTQSDLNFINEKTEIFQNSTSYHNFRGLRKRKYSELSDEDDGHARKDSSVVEIVADDGYIKF